MKKEIRAYLISLPVAIFIMMVFSCTTSPFFDLAYGDYYGNHSSTALLIGKEWLADAIPYKDLFVTGGPLYYLIQAAGWGIAGRTGVWLLQSLWLSVGIYMMQDKGSQNFRFVRVHPACFSGGQSSSKRAQTPLWSVGQVPWGRMMGSSHSAGKRLYVPMVPAGPKSRQSVTRMPSPR